MFLRCTSGDATTLELFSLSCWLWKPITVGFLFLWFHIKKKDFRHFLTKWIQLDTMIVERMSYDQKLVLRHDRAKKVKLELVGYGIWMLFGAAFIGMTQWTTPEFPAFLSYYINNPLDEAQFWWLFPVGFAFQQFNLIVILLAFSHFHVLFIQLADSIVMGLKLITCNEGSITGIHFIEKDKVFSASIRTTILDYTGQFCILDRFIKMANRLLGWPLFFYKTTVSVNFAILMFVPLRFINESNFLSLVIFFWSGLFFAMHMWILLTTLGNVLEESKKFRESWMKALPDLYVLNRSQDSGETYNFLRRCVPFGFRCGSFYLVQPGTILTWFSVTLSYLIILFQLNL
jgi:hypothetical protein